MDTKDRKRRRDDAAHRSRSNASAPGRAAQRRGTAQRRTVRPSRENGPETDRTARRGRSGTSPSGKERPGNARGGSRVVRRRSAPQKRTVRPPREDVPEVIYSLPKPFSKGGFVLKLITVAAVVTALVMGMGLFFKVDQVLVSGAAKYTPWMIREASGIQTGDNLLSVNDAKVAGNVIKALPYVKTVRVGIKLPGTVHIEIEELDTTYAIEARDGSWWLITADGRVVEPILTTAAASYTRILGIQADGPRVDQQVMAAEAAGQNQPEETTQPAEDAVTLPTIVEVTGAARLAAVQEILVSLEENGVIGQIVTVDVSDMNNIAMNYAGRLDVKLGTAENLGYKVQYMALAVAQIEAYQTGELDVSFKYSDQALLNPEE